MLITCNPKKNWLYKHFYKPHIDGTLPKDCAFVQALVYDNPFITPDYIRTLESIGRQVDSATSTARQMGIREQRKPTRRLRRHPRLLHERAADGDGVRRISADLAMKGRDRFVRVQLDGNGR